MFGALAERPDRNLPQSATWTNESIDRRSGRTLVKNSYPGIFIAGGLVVFIAAIGLLYLAGRNSPQAQLARARIVGETDQWDALELVRSIIRTPKADLPEARLFECQLLLDLKRGREAGTSFAAIRPDPNRTRIRRFGKSF